METFEAIRTILAVRSYQDKPIPAEVIRRIVEAGHLTGSSMNKQPWHFIVIEDKATLQKMGELVRTGPYTAQAPLAIVVAVEKDSRFGISDGSRATQSMILTAWSEGVGSNWVGFYPMSEISAALGIPDTMDVLAVLPFGYPEKKLGLGRKRRKPLAEVASKERYGQSFEG